MDVIAVALKNVYDRRKKIKSGYRIVNEAPILRHFTVELAPYAGKNMETSFVEIK